MNNNRYVIEERRDGMDQLYFVITAKGKFAKFLPRDNEFRDRASAERWVSDRLKKDNTNARRREFDDAMRSFGMTKTPYGWE